MRSLGWCSSNLESASLFVRPSIEPLESVRDDAGGKGGDAEGFTGFRTTIIRLSTWSSVNALAADTVGSVGKGPWFVLVSACSVGGGAEGAKSGTAADNGVCVKGPSVIFELLAEALGTGTKGGGAPLDIRNMPSSIE